MITYTNEPLILSDADALVNPVNIQNIAKEGLCVKFRYVFPDNFAAYGYQCWKNNTAIGKLYLWKCKDEDDNIKTIINFPTRRDWRFASRIEYITEGLISLKTLIEEQQIKSIALPLLGCDVGFLNRSLVKAEIEKYLKDLTDIDIRIHLSD